MVLSYRFSVGNDNRLRLFVLYKGKRIALSMGLHVERDKWNAEAQRCRRNTTHGKKQLSAAYINTRIAAAEDKMRAIEESFVEEPTVERFSAELRRAFGKGTGTALRKDFFTVYEQFIREQSAESAWTLSTSRKHERVRKVWKAFAPDMTFADVTSDTLSRFRDYLIAKGYQNETTRKLLSMSKWFFRWAASKKYIQGSDFDEFRTKLKKSSHRVVFLTWEELLKVYAFEFPPTKQYLARARDVFCFCCFTSLRYSDVSALKRSAISGGAMHLTTQKTNDALTIELNQRAQAILDRYADLPGEMALPVPSNQKLNDYIKELCYLCGIDEPITETYYVGGERHERTAPKWQLVGTHCGRRTFICNALMLGISPAIVMKWTGHSNYKSMQPYIDVADSVKASAMSLFDR